MENVKKQPSPAMHAALVGGKLLLICAIIAGLISFVYAITRGQYEANLSEEKRKAIMSIFGSSTLTYEALPAEEGTLYEVTDEGTPLGFCAEITSAGFGGDIQMMIGYDANGKILGVSIVSMSETPGLGSKVNESAFLGQFADKNASLTMGEDVDAISGATISSRAVTDGVNRAMAQVSSYLAAQKGGSGE